MMMDLDSLVFLSLHSMDKIVDSGQVVIEHVGAISESTSTYTNFPALRTVPSTIPNTYGRAGIIRGVYSTDGGNTWRALDAVIPYVQEVEFYISGVFNSTIYNSAWLTQVAVGSDNDNLYFRAISDYCTPTFRVDVNPVTFHATYSLWAPLPQTFIIKWWMFERE